MQFCTLSNKNAKTHSIVCVLQFYDDNQCVRFSHMAGVRVWAGLVGKGNTMDETSGGNQQPLTGFLADAMAEIEKIPTEAERRECLALITYRFLQMRELLPAPPHDPPEKFP